MFKATISYFLHTPDDDEEYIENTFKFIDDCELTAYLYNKLYCTGMPIHGLVVRSRHQIKSRYLRNLIRENA